VIELFENSDDFAVKPNLFRIDLSMSCEPGGLGANNCLPINCKLIDYT
jgi:hypothetical protein